MGCKDKTNALLTYQVYIDLIEVKKFYNVTYNYSQEHNTMFLTAKDMQNSKENIYVPVSSLESVSFNKMEQLLEMSVNDSKS